jgi:hypothetical protein
MVSVDKKTVLRLCDVGVPFVPSLIMYRMDRGTETKRLRTARRRYAGAQVQPRLVVERAVRKAVWGVSDPDFISTSYIERQGAHHAYVHAPFDAANERFLEEGRELTARTRDHFAYYNLCRKRMLVKNDAGNQGGSMDRIWTLRDLADLPDVLDDSLAS